MELCDLKVHIDEQQEQHTFLLHQRVLCSFSGKLKKMVRQERKRCQAKGPGLKLGEFPGGAHGFELASRFCYDSGGVVLTPSNVCILHCAAVALEMREDMSEWNLLRRTEEFLEGAFQWTWSETLTALKSCEPFLPAADSCGLLHGLVSAVLAKISANSELPPLSTQPPSAAALNNPSSSSSSSSPDTFGVRWSSSTKTPEPMKPCSSREWWFDDLAVLAPATIEKMMLALGAYGSDNRNLILTRFLLHYLKAVVQKPRANKELYGGLADTAVHGVILMGRTAFSCRGLFWVLRVVSGLGIGRECRQKLERLMGLMLDQATLDDLLVSGHDNGGAYDVNLVLRLVRIFVSGEEGGGGAAAATTSLQRMKKVGRLIDKYLGEISPDQSLKVSKFLEVAESLPDSARDCFDGVYRALDIYLESHSTLPTEERTRLCRCLNYEKLTLEACKDLAKNRRIPPRVAVQALASQQSKIQVGAAAADRPEPSQTPRRAPPEEVDEKEQLRLNLQRMQCRVKELEKVCRSMKGQMSKMAKAKSISHGSRGMPRLC